MPIAIFAGAISICIWAFLLLARGAFWRVSATGVGQVTTREVKIVAIVPARNEADVIARAVSSLLLQQRVAIRVIVVNDASTDGTDEVARSAAEKVGALDRLQVVNGSALPEGWSG